MTILTSKIRCECSLLRKDHEKFQGWNDFDKFKDYVSKAVFFKEIEVAEKLYDIGGLEEKWFLCSNCSIKWRLVEPDPPYAGQWVKVE